MKDFKKDYVGRLLWAEADPNSRFKYTIWFDYTRKLVNELSEGDLVAAPNFATDSNGICYSILQLISVMPVHYALGTDKRDLRGFPGFVMQAAKSASADWTEQEYESYEDTTKVICEAIPTNLEYNNRNKSAEIINEKAMAMVGKDVYILNNNLTNKIFNKDINAKTENVIQIGNLIRDERVKILVRTDDLIKTHFGIFGFTGVGKSNLISSMISNLSSTKDPVKIVLFDLMDEYTGLLIDQLLVNNGKIICIGENTLMKPVFNYINQPSNDKLNQATKIFLKNILLPKGLRAEKEKYSSSIKELLKGERIKIFEEIIRTTVKNFLDDIWSDVISRLGPLNAGKLNKMKSEVFNHIMDDELSPQLAKALIKKLGFEGFREQPLPSVTAVIQESDLKERLEYTLIEPLKQISKGTKDKISENVKITMRNIIDDLNDDSISSLYIVISHDSNRVRRFAFDLGRYLFLSRRTTGLISPTSLFLFDEADQFIPGKPRNESEKLSTSIIETLSRRGRKFGIGVGIATQRSAYLDTNIMGQLHTYFISKLPREYDRTVVGEAFSLSKDQFSQTFKFGKGQWLLVSHEATGIDMPIPIQAPNAEQRIKHYIEGSD